MDDNEQKIAKARSPINRRVWTDDYHKLGVIGEAEFAKEFGLPFGLATAVHPGGDGGKDFVLPVGRIDVKTSRKAYSVMCHKDIADHDKADIIVQTQYFDRTESATLLAWEFVKNIKKYPIHYYGGQPFHMMPVNRAFPIWGLKKMVKKSEGK